MHYIYMHIYNVFLAFRMSQCIARLLATRGCVHLTVHCRYNKTPIKTSRCSYSLKELTLKRF